jgi:hypothetical protein
MLKEGPLATHAWNYLAFPIWSRGISVWSAFIGRSLASSQDIKAFSTQGSLAPNGRDVATKKEKKV